MVQSFGSYLEFFRCSASFSTMPRNGVAVMLRWRGCREIGWLNR